MLILAVTLCCLLWFPFLPDRLLAYRAPAVLGTRVAGHAVAPAAALDQPTLTLEFEDGFDGAGRAGPVVATVEGKPERAPGKLGQALLSGPSTGYLSFATEGIVKPTAGSVEAWVCTAAILVSSSFGLFDSFGVTSRSASSGSVGMSFGLSLIHI